mmetsp:Transcript_46572/g.96164  ORF Transcript_46572/g.96164 Transcript_46572/m.96164 type:complete len:233 (-) Transcript_46572:172-870(-)
MYNLPCIRFRQTALMAIQEPTHRGDALCRDSICMSASHAAFHRPSRSSKSNCSWRRRANASSSSISACALAAFAAPAPGADVWAYPLVGACPALLIAASAAAARASLRWLTSTASAPKARPDPSKLRKASSGRPDAFGLGSSLPVMELTDFLIQLPTPLRPSPTADAASPILAPAPLATSPSRSPTPGALGADAEDACRGAVGSSPLPNRPPPQFWWPICRTFAASLHALHS